MAKEFYDVKTILSTQNIFKEMKENLNQKCSNLIALINQRKLALDLKIDELEMEYSNERKQIEKDKQTMVDLREITEQRLGQNSLLDVQTDLVSDINKKIKNLEKESELHLDLVLTLNWDFDGLKLLIGQMDLQLTPQNRFLSTGNTKIRSRSKVAIVTVSSSPPSSSSFSKFYTAPQYPGPQTDHTRAIFKKKQKNISKNNRTIY